MQKLIRLSISACVCNNTYVYSYIRFMLDLNVHCKHIAALDLRTRFNYIKTQCNKYISPTYTPYRVFIVRIVRYRDVAVL